MEHKRTELIKLLLITGPYLMHKVMSDFDTPEVGLNLNRTQWKALMIIAGKEHSNMGQLSKFMNLEKGSVTSVVDGLINNGLLVRVQDHKDRRKIRLALTEKSRPVVEQARSLLHAHVIQKLDHLDDNEKDLLHNSLKNILSISEKL